MHVGGRLVEDGDVRDVVGAVVGRRLGVVRVDEDVVAAKGHHGGGRPLVDGGVVARGVVADILGVVTIRIHVWRGWRVEAKTETALDGEAEGGGDEDGVARVRQRVQEIAGMGHAL